MPDKRKSRRPGASIQARPASAPRGRVTPKATSSTGGRYTAPVPRGQKVSPRWVPVLMGTLLAAGMLVIVLNYIGLLPAAPTNWYLIVGLALITFGFIVATRWH